MEDNDAPLPGHLEEKRKQLLENSECITCGEEEAELLALRPVHYRPGCKAFGNDPHFDPFDIECDDCWERYGKPENRMEVRAEEEGNIFVEYECGTVNEIKLPDQEGVPYDSNEFSNESEAYLLCLCGENMSRVVFPDGQELTL